MKLLCLVALISFNITICSSLIEIEQAIIDANVEKVEQLLAERTITKAAHKGLLDLAEKWVKNTKHAYKKSKIFKCRHSFWPFFTGSFFIAASIIKLEAVERRGEATPPEIAEIATLFAGGIGFCVWGYKNFTAEKKERMKLYLDALRIKQLVYQAKISI